MEKSNILVVVHPGSACGSATFNLGKSDARVFREFLANDISRWQGAIFVIDGDLSEELPDFPNLNQAIDGALVRAGDAGLLAQRIDGCDSAPFNQVDAINELIEEHSLSPETVKFEVTGAWYDPSDLSGCVNSVVDAVRDAGFTADIRDSALSMEGDDYDDELDVDEELGEELLIAR